MKKLFGTLLLSAALLLGSCAASNSPAVAEANLKNAGYKVQSMNQEEAKASIIGVTWNVTVSTAVFGTKDAGSIFLGFYCANIDDATAFMTENIRAMVTFAEKYAEGPKVGSNNNLAYVASADALQIVGLVAAI